MLSNKKITSTVAEVEMAKAELEAKMAEAKIVETQIQKDNNLYPFSKLFKLSADDNNVAKHDEHTPYARQRRATTYRVEKPTHTLFQKLFLQLLKLQLPGSQINEITGNTEGHNNASWMFVYLLN